MMTRLLIRGGGLLAVICLSLTLAAVSIGVATAGPIIVYVSGELGSGNITLMDLNRPRLTMIYDETPHNDISPRWSPDGQKIAYLRSGTWHLFVIDSDGSNHRQLTPPRPRPQHLNNLRWSPDGRYIYVMRLEAPVEPAAVLRFDTEQNDYGVEMDIDDEGVQAYLAALADTRPVSPDETFIYQLIGTEIWLYRGDELALTVILPEASNYSMPLSWSPDSRFFIVDVWRGLNERVLYRVDLRDDRARVRYIGNGSVPDVRP